MRRRPPHVHALWGARVARARVARAASPAAAAADGPPRSVRLLARHQGSRRRAASHRGAATRTPVALLSARRRRCCTSARSPRSRSQTSSGRPTSPTAADPGCSGTSGSAPCPPRSWSSAVVCASRMCTRGQSHSPPAASPVCQSAWTIRTPANVKSIPSLTRLIHGWAHFASRYFSYRFVTLFFLYIWHAGWVSLRVSVLKLIFNINRILTLPRKVKIQLVI